MSKIFIFFLSLILAIILFPRQVTASEGTFFKYMVNADSSKVASQKGLSLGYQDEFLFLETKWELGLIADNSNRAGAKSSGFGSYSIGVEPHWQSFYINFFQGIAAITCPDTVLGGPLQFVEDFGFGIRDTKKGTAIGFNYKHISSAGIFQPNQGRDLVGLQIMIPW